MRYRVPVLAATVAAMCLFTAGPALAGSVPGTVDQQQADNSWSAAGFGAVTLGQSFTVGRAGSLTAVAVDVNPSAPATTTTATLSIFAVDGSGLPTGSALASHQATAGNGSVAFVFASPLAVTVGEKLAITFSWDASETLEWRGTCGTGYSAGEALMNEGSGWETFAAYVSHHELNTDTYCLQDFTFATYVLAPPTQTTKLQWDKTQVAAGVTTPLTLTETFTFAVGAAPTVVGVPAALVGADWSLRQVALPSWFAVTGVACSSQIAPADCILANMAPGSSIPVTPDGDPIIVTLTGTASPPPSAAGTTGTATGEGCVTPVVANPVPVCLADQATVAVGAFTVTAAPTTTGSNGSSRDSTPPLALLVCLALGGLGLAAVEVRRWSARS